MKQTATEWLFQQLWETPIDKLTWYAILKQAKDIEKQQIIEAHAVGRIKECSGINTDGEQYYNETFKSE